MKQRKPNWTPFKRAVAKTHDPYGAELFLNSRYQVAVKGYGEYAPFGRVWEISLKRLDKEPIYDWRDMQRIKNEFFGEGSTMIQLFPPEKHLVDTANQYFFFVLPEYEFPFGFKARLLNNHVDLPTDFGVGKQRPFDAEHMPVDLEMQQGRFDDAQRELYIQKGKS